MILLYVMTHDSQSLCKEAEGGGEMLGVLKETLGFWFGNLGKMKKGKVNTAQPLNY